MSNRTAPRTWTDTQLAHKRRQDRSAQRRNRAETKTRLENIENNISFLRGNMEELLAHFHGGTSLAMEYCPIPGSDRICPFTPANGVFVSCIKWLLDLV